MVLNLEPFNPELLNLDFLNLEPLNLEPLNLELLNLTIIEKCGSQFGETPKLEIPLSKNADRNLKKLRNQNTAIEKMRIAS